jgi:YHS domain-containing protein
MCALAGLDRNERKHIMIRQAGLSLAILGVLLVGCSGNGDAGHGEHDHESSKKSVKEHGSSHDDAAHAEMNKMCPVIDDAATTEIYTVYKGKKVYFCCDHCIEDFEKDPEKYFAKAYPHAADR